MKRSVIISHENVGWHYWFRYGFSFELWYQRYWIFCFLYRNIGYLILWHVTRHGNLIQAEQERVKCTTFFFLTHLSLVFKYVLSNITSKTGHYSVLNGVEKKNPLGLYVCEGAWQNEAKCYICMATANTLFWILAWWPLATCFSVAGLKEHDILPWVNPYN